MKYLSSIILKFLILLLIVALFGSLAFTVPGKILLKIGEWYKNSGLQPLIKIGGNILWKKIKVINLAF